MILLIPYLAVSAGLAVAGYGAAAALLLGILAAAVLCTLELRPGRPARSAIGPARSAIGQYRSTRLP